MVARPGEWRPQYNAGEFGPDFDARVDIREYFSACRRMRNAEPMPQGGFRAMPGSVEAGKARGQMVAVDASRVVTTGPHAVEATVEEITLDVAGAVSAVTIEGYSIAENRSVTVKVQAEIAAVWTDFGDPVTLDNLTRNRTVALAPGTSVTATKIRLRVITAASVTWSNSGTVLWRETADLPEAIRLHDYAFSRDEAYVLAVTPGWCDVWRAGTWRSAFRLPGMTAAMIPDVDLYADGNTVGFFHPDLRTLRAFRSGGDEKQWNVDFWPYADPPPEQFLDTDYFVPLAGATPSHQNSTGGTAANIVDGDLATASVLTVNALDVSVADPANRIATLDFGEVKRISRVRCNIKNGGGSTQVGYFLLSQDGTNWFRTSLVGGAPLFEGQIAITSTAAWHEIQFDAEARYVALALYGGSFTPLGQNPFTIYQFEAWGYEAGIDAIQDIYFTGTLTDKLFTLAVEGSTTPQITWSASIAADVKDALEALPNVGPGLDVQLASANVLRIRFTGDANRSRPWANVVGVPISTDIAILQSNVREGRVPGEPVISVARGWPGVAELVQERICYGGPKGRPTALLFSQAGEVFDLQTESGGAAAGIAVAVRETVAEVIQHVVWSKYLLILTDEGEYFANNREVDATQPLNFVRASNIGSLKSVGVQEAEGLVYFADRTGSLLYMATYDDVQSSYVATPQSLFASHLFRNVAESALVRPDARSGAHRLYYRRSDGRLIQAMVIRDQQINAFSEWATDGEVLSVAADRAGTVWLAVRRTYADGAAINIERMDEAQWLHGAVDFGATDLAGVLSGLDAREGQTVWVVADGRSLGSYEVTDGEITLPQAFTNCIVGWWTPPLVEHMPLYLVLRDETVVRRPGRISRVRARVEGTTSIAIAANGEPARDVPLYRGGMVVDAALPAQTREIEAGGLTGRISGTTATITQTIPGALQVRDVVLEAKL